MSPGEDGPIRLPEPTPWPMVVALGLTLACTGLVTTRLVAAVGGALVALGSVMLIREDIARRGGPGGA